MDLAQLTPYQKRAFVPQGADLTDQATVLGLYEKLEKQQINSVQDLDEWLLRRSELDAALSQAGSILYIRMTCQTDDPAAAGAYTKFVQTIPPAVEPVNDRLNRKYLETCKTYPLDAKRYEVYDRAVKTSVELFVPENVPLQTKVALLSQEYQTVTGSMTVHFEGREQTLPQMGKYLLETDSSLRERAWKATAERRLKDKDKLEELFDAMFKLRNDIAHNAGFSIFTDYQFKAYQRFDYTPADCKKYHETVEKLIVPLNGKILKRRKEQMKLNALRPWDTSVDPLGEKPLAPFSQPQELIRGTSAIFNKLDGDFGLQFAEMEKLGLLDLASRKGKAPGGYQSTLSEARKPFIFMNAVGVDDDLRTLLHESGHAFHCLACACDPILDYRHGPMEFCEVASMAMELLGGEHLGEFYGPHDLQRSRREHLEGIIQVLAWVANIDAFQHWLYEHPRHSAAERSLAWNELYERFGARFIDWGGLSEVKNYLWHRQLHIFELPFYYIEYGIAQLGALQVWLNARRDPKKALGDYKRALALGGSRPVRELYRAAGISFDFSEEIIKPLVEAVTQEWERLA
ncbi:MAG: M3 family oligoendopeptidase [Candidatus Omnitrophica bacterium]|nr:M3 family oligoendopeptidase [Candidatus Omnitrophota bacterium]MDE2231072.1 M3 family oligoendopeptidase [Candidatus Omnitrophota bacterium]